MKPANAPSLALSNPQVFQIFALFLLPLAGCGSKDLSRSKAESPITETSEYQIEYAQGAIKKTRQSILSEIRRRLALN